MTGQYLLDKPNAKLMGVCAGFANWSGIDPTAIRLAAVLSFFLIGPLALLLYLLTGWIAPEAC